MDSLKKELETSRCVVNNAGKLLNKLIFGNLYERILKRCTKSMFFGVQALLKKIIP